MFKNITTLTWPQVRKITGLGATVVYHRVVNLLSAAFLVCTGLIRKALNTNVTYLLHTVTYTVTYNWIFPTAGRLLFHAFSTLFNPPGIARVAKSSDLVAFLHHRLRNRSSKTARSIESETFSLRLVILILLIGFVTAQILVKLKNVNKIYCRYNPSSDVFVVHLQMKYHKRTVPSYSWNHFLRRWTINDSLIMTHYYISLP